MILLIYLYLGTYVSPIFSHIEKTNMGLNKRNRSMSLSGRRETRLSGTKTTTPIRNTHRMQRRSADNEISPQHISTNLK